NASISRVNQDKLLMESNLRIMRDQLAKATEAATAAGDPVRTQTKSEELARREREIQQVEQTLAQYKEMYKDTHPDVRRLQGNLETLRKQRDATVKADEEE